MIFKRVNQKEEDVAPTLRHQLYNAASHDAKGSMSHSRFFMTFVSLFFGIVFSYASIFYVPAFMDIQKVMGISTEAGKLPRPDTDRGKLESYAEYFKIRRGYLRRGQALTLEYDLAPGTVMTATIKRCGAPPVVEVFYCQNIEGQQVKITSDQPGKRSFIMRKPGFYYFDEVITQKDGSPTDTKYKVAWSRRSFSPA